MVASEMLCVELTKHTQIVCVVSSYTRVELVGEMSVQVPPLYRTRVLQDFKYTILLRETREVEQREWKNTVVFLDSCKIFAIPSSSFGMREIWQTC